ncbi:hypothetical protein CRUP_019928 [Coryphaenoides rupestris]|nr:hypothetical protein CRUP_019928 [Coryphaenoides rupestris]
MTEVTDVAVVSPVEDECHDHGPPATPTVEEQEQDEEGGGGGGEGLTPSQRDVLERCLHALTHAKNDSHTLAALLLITRICPASQLDKPTLRRIFEAVGLNLPARLLVTTVRGGSDAASASLPREELLSLGTALLAALSTDPDMASHPHLLSTVPLLLGLLADGPSRGHGNTGAEPHSGPKDGDGDDGGGGVEGEEAQQGVPTPRLDGAMAADCYQILEAVLSQEKGLPLLGCLLSCRSREKAWRKHPDQLLSLLALVTARFCLAKDQARLDKCVQVLQFLPPPGVATDSAALKEAVSALWAELRPMMQAKLTPRQIGPILVLSACLLDLCGWELVGPPKFCCLMVNRACVEVRMGLEEPPGTDLSPELQNTLTGCYRIMEAAMEQACSQGVAQSDAPPQAAIAGISLQQSRQVLLVLQEAFSALIYHLQQVDPSRYGDPFVFATFRSLCSWLAEETSCLKEEVAALLPFLIGYAKAHLAGEGPEPQSLSHWLSEMSVEEEEGRAWTDTLLVDFVSRGWGRLKGRSGVATPHDPSLETACSALLNFTVTEPDRVRKDPCFRTLESFLSEALPVLVHKPRLLILAANFCTLGLMIGRLRPKTSGPAEPGARRFYSAALRFLRGALAGPDPPGPNLGPGTASGAGGAWAERWPDAQELWRLSLRALAACVRAQPWLSGLVREEGWLRGTLALLEAGARLPDADPQTRGALEETLCALAERCPACRSEIGGSMRGEGEGGGGGGEGGTLGGMGTLRKAVGVK